MIILALTLSASFATSNDAPYLGKHEEIPDNLPWYFVAVFGDNRPSTTWLVKYPDVYYMLINEVSISNPFAVIGTGDHTGSGLLEQMLEFVRTVENLSNVWVIEGNHDIGGSEARTYWLSNIAADMYFRDDFPGWRFIFFSTELPRTKWDNLTMFLNQSLNTNRKAVLVFHRPLFPYVDHNIDSDLASLIKPVIRSHDNVVLALQGHWHGYTSQVIGGVRYVITGGAGAPPYDPGTAYHYLYLILYPNGTYMLTTVKIKEGNLTVKRSNDSVIITNTKLDIYLDNVSIPMRTWISYKDINVSVVLIANPGNTTISILKEDSNVYLTINPETQWYAYYATENETDVLIPEDNRVLIYVEPSPTTTSTITTTTTTSTTSTTTTTTKTTTSSTTETGVQTPPKIPVVELAVAIAVVAALIILIRRLKR
jgi:hypothetical protein